VVQQQQQQQLVQPAEPIAPVRQPVQQPVEEQVLNPGDLICGKCGKGNAPTRNFCSRCGASLAESEVVKTSWWRRLFGRKPKEHKAGERPGKDGVRRRTGRAGAARRTVGKVIRRAVVVPLQVATAFAAELDVGGPLVPALRVDDHLPSPPALPP
jgi:hypothetical protein